MSERGLSNAMLGVIGGVGMLGALAALVYALAFLGGSSETAAPSGDVYVSLGDSVAAGNGASDPAAAGFAAVLATRREVTLYNIATAGAATQQVLDEQLAQALPLLGSGRVAFITISAGGNDLAALIPNASCTEEPPPASCPLEETIAAVAGRIDEILRMLRDADPRVPIVLLGYPNFFDGTGHVWAAPAGAVLPELTDAMEIVASGYDGVGVATPSFETQAAGTPLTHVLDEPFDPHPNDAGHAIIADAIESALDAIEE